MSYNSRRLLTPGSRKRKDREPPLYPSTSPKPLAPSTSVSTVPKPNSNQTTSLDGCDNKNNNNNHRLLAGYMAFEFLTKGTLLGQKFDPARPEPVGSEPDPNSYEEMANIIKSGGAHIPGVVNPTQLGSWIVRM